MNDQYFLALNLCIFSCFACVMCYNNGTYKQFENINVTRNHYFEHKPIYSIVMPVHNSEAHISQVLEALLRRTMSYFELIIIYDFCLDRSKAIGDSTVLTYAKTNENLTSYISAQSHIPLFETSATNFGFRSSHGDFICLVQDDMVMQITGWNILLSLPLVSWQDVVSSSARCAHELGGKESQKIGRCGADVDGKLHVSDVSEAFHIRDTTNRGPLIVRRDAAERLGLFDENNFVNGDDDHDFHVRAWLKYRMVTGALLLPFYSPLSWGGTRRQTHVDQAYENQLLQARLAKSTGGTLLLHKKSMPHSTITRYIPQLYNTSFPWIYRNSITFLIVLENSTSLWYTSIRHYYPFNRIILFVNSHSHLKLYQDDPMVSISAWKDRKWKDVIHDYTTRGLTQFLIFNTSCHLTDLFVPEHCINVNHAEHLPMHYSNDIYLTYCREIQCMH